MEDLKGLVFKSVENQTDQIVFTTENDEVYRMYHSQDCCESVLVDDVIGDLNDLVGSPILFAEESTNTDAAVKGKDGYEPSKSWTWTFYKFATVKGWVDIRWFGTSNGYYSESVSIRKD